MIENRFIKLILEDDQPIIIGLNNIASVTSREENTGCKILLNFSRGKDMSPKTYYVKESFNEIEKLLASYNSLEKVSDGERQ